MTQWSSYMNSYRAVDNTRSLARAMRTVSSGRTALPPASALPGQALFLLRPLTQDNLDDTAHAHAPGCRTHAYRAWHRWCFSRWIDIIRTGTQLAQEATRAVMRCLIRGIGGALHFLPDDT